MSDLKKDWVPEVGKECLFKHWDYGWIIVKILAKHPRENVYWFEGVSLDHTIEENSNTSTASVGFFRPKQIEAIEQCLNYWNNRYRGSKTVAEYLHNAGCRMTRELTDEVIDKIWKAPQHTVNGINYHRVFAKAIEAYILGEN